MEYEYDEVYFQTADSESAISADIEKYWESGQEWEPAVPMTQNQKISFLEKQVVDAKADLAQSRMDNDMVIAEMTMVMAAMMGGE